LLPARGSGTFYVWGAFAVTIIKNAGKPYRARRRVRLAYFDDVTVFREALTAVLEDRGAITVVHTSGHSAQNIRPLLDLPVSVILVALHAQTNDPMATVREARFLLPELPICVLVGGDSLESVRGAMAAGCGGAVSTMSNLNMLISALESLSNGHDFVDPSLAGRLLTNIVTSRRTKSGMTALAAKSVEPE
jgi:DNA-binding NarL/FixJ family response regulator